MQPSSVAAVVSARTSWTKNWPTAHSGDLRDDLQYVSLHTRDR